MSANHVPPSGVEVTRPVPPWWAIHGDPGVAAQVAAAGTDGGLEVRVIPGERLRTAGGLFVEFALAWGFPSYFGHNWSALEDCLVDLAWLPAAGYLCVVTGAGHLLRDEPDDVLGLCLDLLARVGATWAAPVALGQAWDRPATPFHTLLATRSDRSAGILRARAAAGGADLGAGS